MNVQTVGGALDGIFVKVGDNFPAGTRYRLNGDPYVLGFQGGVMRLLLQKEQAPEAIDLDRVQPNTDTDPRGLMT